MRQSNAEWDFMGRTYLVLALANLALRAPQEQARHLAVMDAIIAETLRLEREHGIYYFLMDYARDGAFLGPGGRSVFQDGEIALMLAARRLVAEHPAYVPLLRERIALIETSMRAGPLLCAESYPNECWMFCNTVALAALRLSDVLDGGDHTAFFREWAAKVCAKLRDPATGLLVSSFTRDGYTLDGPEGSSIWMVAHCLQLVDPALAADQYQRACAALARRPLGFGYSLEWPPSWRGATDIDSGPVIPLLGISPGASGLAFVGAAAFDDQPFLSALLTSLRYGGFPAREAGGLRFHASNQVGDAVLLYALVQGPLWERARPAVAARTEAPR